MEFEKEKILEIKGISAGYGKLEVLFDINMEIEKLDTLLLMGPNGSGKSTIIKVIAGLLKPNKGEIFYKGENITTFSVEKRINMGIGYLRQTRNIFPALTVRENLEIGGYGLKPVDLKNRIEKVLSFFPFLGENINKRAGFLSGGERQALAIGMVLMKEKELLILDEPTAGLAPSAAKSILENIANIKEMIKLTILIVEHNIKEMLSLANKVIALSEGRIKLIDTSKNLLENYQKMEEIFFK